MRIKIEGMRVLTANVLNIDQRHTNENHYSDNWPYPIVLYSTHITDERSSSSIMMMKLFDSYTGLVKIVTRIKK